MIRKPDESLDDFTLQHLLDLPAEPPQPVTLRFTGEVEVLKPLTSAYVRRTSSRALWFRRSLAIGGGMAVIALIFASAVFVGMYEEIRQIELAQVTDVEIVTPPEKRSLLAEQPAVPNVAPDMVVIPISESPTPQVKSPVPRHRRASRSAVKMPSQSQLAGSEFVPTTLVIYIDKGEVKTRIEPQLTASLKKTSTPSN